MKYSAGIDGKDDKQGAPAWRVLRVAVAAVLGVLFPGIAQGATPAGTRITNVAQLTTVDAGVAKTVASNPVDLIVAEQLDVTLTRDGVAPVVVAGSGTPVAVTLTNTGNGTEAFAVVATPGDDSATVRLIAIDTDGDGRFDPAHDQALANGQTPALAPGQSLALLVVLDPARDAVTATTLVIGAQAVTGSGTPGTDFPARGDGGGDAIVGPTGAQAQVTVALGTAAPAPTLIKTQSVLAPDGTTRPMHGAIVTYSLEAHFPLATSGARIDDPVPAGTLYVPGSLRLDAQPLTDAADGDPGSVGTDGIAVTLGDVAAAATRTVRFQVRIQ